MTSRLLLVRHAMHDRVASVLCGRMPDVHLTAAGRCQAEALASRLAREAPAAVHASPQPRAQETALPIARRCGLPVATEDALDEIEFGAWQGRAFAALAGDPRWHAWNAERASATPPGGEAMRAVQRRVVGWALRIMAGGADGPVVAVSHGDVIKAMVAAVLDLSLDAHWRFEIAPASVSAIGFDTGTPRLLWMNEVPT